MRMLNTTKLRQTRKAQALTMRQLGEQIGVTESAISLYERGHRMPSIVTLRLLENALRVKKGSLLI